VSFDVAATAYDRFMGRFSGPLAGVFADAAGVRPGVRALDVGCGPGALTSVLVQRLGVEHVSAVDPSPPFVEAVRSRLPGVDVTAGSAESLKFADDSFDVTLAQLVVHFMADPVSGLAEMARVTSPGGVVAACVWDHAGGQGPLSPFWDAVHELYPGSEDESGFTGSRQGQLVELFEAAGLADVQQTTLPASVTHSTFDEWWEPFTLAVGPAGKFLAGLDDAGKERLREACRGSLSDAPVVTARAWTVRGNA
jgi:SAM-dependent methyltransferase